MTSDTRNVPKEVKKLEASPHTPSLQDEEKMKGKTTKPKKTLRKNTENTAKSPKIRENETSSSNKKKDVKKRLWTIVLYPESAPEDWREVIKQSGIVFAVSPLHDRDINADGTPKKPHHHLILAYSGPTTYNNVKSFCDELNQPVPKPLESVRGMYRYFTHEENPEKAQYDKELIEHYNGFSLANFCELMRGEVLEIKKSVFRLIAEANITEYSDLVYLLLDNEMYDELDVVTSNTMLFNTIITSRRHGAYREEVE